MVETPPRADVSVESPPTRAEEAAVAQAASVNILADVTPPPPISQTAAASSDTGSTARDTPVTNFRGAACKKQPGQEQVPTLEPGARGLGCTYRNANDLLRPGQGPEFNTASLYATAQQQTVHFSVPQKEKGMRSFQDTGGSGVMVGRSENECYIATANHVIQPIPNTQQGDRAAITPDGKRYPFQVKHSDPGKDIAIVALQTGIDTDKICKPAKFAENTDYRGPAVAFGFPEGSKSLYASPGSMKDVVSFKQLLQRFGARLDPREQQTDDMNRPMVHVNNGQVRGGDSGGPLYTGTGEVTGLVQGGADGLRRDFGVTVLTAPMVRELLQRIQRRL